MIDLANGRIDRYELRERIGSGGMARVYKAWDTNLERLVAIKILHEHLSDDPTFKERFEREAKFIASFNHPNIVQVYDFNMTERNGIPLCYMVMSFIPGKTLRDVLEEAEAHGERLPSARVLELVTNLTDALGYAHARGMVHRDVKPGNVILNEHGQAVLTDFGIARMVQSNRLTQDGVSTGTPIYMSPEQASGQPGDMRSDLYSLAIIVYEMLSGRPPFADDTSVAVMLRHLNETPEPVSVYSGSRLYDDFLKKALAKNPDDRFQTAGEFAREFRRLAALADHDKTTILPSQRPIPVAKPTPQATSVLQTISLQVRQHPRTSTAVVVAFAGVAALLVLLMTNATAGRGDTPTALPPATSSVPSMTASNPYFTSTFASDDPFNAEWSTTSTDSLTRQLTADGRYQLRNTNPFTAETSLFEADNAYKNMSITMTARLESGSEPASGYGIVFRYQDEDNYNVFAVDGMGRFSIWTRANGEWHELRDADENWTPDDAVHPLGEDNTLSITLIGSFITAYVNNARVTRVTDDTLPAGKIGVYFATDDGEATVSIDEYKVYSSVPSMTTGS